jgi:anti-anti-sigma factor
MIGQPSASGVIVVPLGAEIDLTNRDQVYDRLYAALLCGAAVVIADFSGTRFCDCASLRRLVAVQQRAADCGSQLRLLMPSGSQVRRVASLLGLDGQFLIYSSVREASAWLPSPGEPLPRTASLRGPGPVPSGVQGPGVRTGELGPGTEIGLRIDQILTQDATRDDGDARA